MNCTGYARKKVKLQHMSRSADYEPQ